MDLDIKGRGSSHPTSSNAEASPPFSLNWFHHAQSDSPLDEVTLLQGSEFQHQPWLLGGRVPLRLVENATISLLEADVLTAVFWDDLYASGYLESSFRGREHNTTSVTYTTLLAHGGSVWESTTLPDQVTEVVHDREAQRQLIRASDQEPQVVPGLQWILNTVSPRDDMTIMGVEIHGLDGTRWSVTVDLLLQQDHEVGWYERAENLEVEWLREFPELAGIVQITPWPARRYE